MTAVQYSTAIFFIFSTFSRVTVNTGYPVSGSWFKPRYSLSEWDSVLTKFQKTGGDTVLTRGQTFYNRTKADIISDPDFKWCRTTAPGRHCVEETEDDLSKHGLSVEFWVTYKSEEDHGAKVMTCAPYEKMYNGSRIYRRLVFQAKNMYTGDDCDFSTSKAAIVIFTLYSGMDSNQLLVESASKKNMSVFLGLPRLPDLDETDSHAGDLFYVYFGLINRLLQDYEKRFANPNGKSLTGYYSADGADMGGLVSIDGQSPKGYLVQVYRELSFLVGYQKKKFAISLYANLNKFKGNYTITNHVNSFQSYIFLPGAIFIVHEGRGMGNMAYYWKNENNTSIASRDPMLFNILQSERLDIPQNATFDEVFNGSVQELFEALYGKRVEGNPEVWLNIEAFENLRDYPCLPLDKTGSGMDRLMERTVKSRLDWSIAAAGSFVQKVSSFAWDADFECLDGGYSTSLADDIISEGSKPIVSHCRFHSPSNESIVVIGYNLDGLTQGYTVTWVDRYNKTQVDTVHGYYFEMDYGIVHGLVPSLQYVMLWDIPNMQNIAPTGFIKVAAGGAYHSCSFPYIYRYT